MNVRKRSAALVSTAAVVTLLAGCGGDGGNDAGNDAAGEGALSGPVTMRVYPLLGEGEDEAFWEPHVAAFKQDHPGVDVTVDVQPWADRDRALTAAIAGGAAPDVVYMIPDEVAQFQAQGVLEPLTDRLEEDGYRQNALDSVTIDGELYGAPILMSAIPGSCDAQVLEEAGIDAPPTTWDELMELGPVLEEHGFYATHIVASNEATLNTTFYPWVWQAGGSVFAEDGTPTIDSPEVVEALQYLVDMTEAGYISRDEAAVNAPAEQSPIGRREVACIYHLDPITVEQFWGEDTVVAPPLMNEADTIYGTVGAYTLLNASENKEAATAWLQYITSAEVMGELDEAAGYYPPREDADVTFAEGSIEAQVEEYLGQTSAGPTVPGAREVQGVIAPEVQAAILGSKSPQEALAAAQRAAEAVLASN